MVTRLRNFTVAALFISTTGYAQYKGDARATDVMRLTFLPPGISYENAIGDNQTLFGMFFFNTTFSWQYSSLYGDEFEFSLDPGAQLQYRYYYNLRGRAERGKRTTMNSANYIAPMVTMVFTKERVRNYDIKEENRRSITTVGLMWGMQRNYRRHFSLDLNAGVGYYFTTGSNYDGNGNVFTSNRRDWTTMLGLTLGFWLNGR